MTHYAKSWSVSQNHLAVMFMPQSTDPVSLLSGSYVTQMRLSGWCRHLARRSEYLLAWNSIPQLDTASHQKQLNVYQRLMRCKWSFG